MIRFEKMQGLGNDFVVIEAMTQTVALTRSMVRKLADRHFGIGCDQVLLLSESNAEGCDYSYQIFNADGQEVEQCGNGARCVGRFLYERGFIDKPEITLATLGGKTKVKVNQDNRVTVNLGIPEFAPADIPFLAEHTQPFHEVTVKGETVRLSVANVGNPHATLLVDDVEQADVQGLGALLEEHPLFPEKVNVGFMQIVDQHMIKVRVFERGVGETLACGTGACAAAVIAIRYHKLQSPVTVMLTGGKLEVVWQGDGAPIQMTGPAEFVFSGEWQST